MVRLQILIIYDLVDQTMATCVKNHPLFRRTRKELMKEDSGYARPFICDMCDFQPKSKGYIAYHCSKCGYDLCSKCYKKGRFRIHAVKEDILSNQKRFRFLQMCESLQS